jgi:hypothetical protein
MKSWSGALSSRRRAKVRAVGVSAASNVPVARSRALRIYRRATPAGEVVATQSPAASESLHRRYGSPMPAFEMQFPLEQVREYAARYAYQNDTEVIHIGQLARERGYYTRDEFLAVCRWKTPRSAPLVALNSAESIEAATGVALSESSTERERIKGLRSLQGVDWATASVFLHLAYPERYPILDTRALQALGVRPPATFSFHFWESYVAASRDLAEQAGMDGRTFDQALWQWSKEQGVPLY